MSTQGGRLNVPGPAMQLIAAQKEAAGQLLLPAANGVVDTRMLLLIRPPAGCYFPLHIKTPKRLLGPHARPLPSTMPPRPYTCHSLRLGFIFINSKP